MLLVLCFDTGLAQSWSFPWGNGLLIRIEDELQVCVVEMCESPVPQFNRI